MRQFELAQAIGAIAEESRWERRTWALGGFGNRTKNVSPAKRLHCPWLNLVPAPKCF